MKDRRPLFDDDTWEDLPNYFGQLPEPVRLHVWGDQEASRAEFEAVRLARTLANQFNSIDFAALPRRANYPFYPVIGVLGVEEGGAIDFGVRIIGLPAGYQMTAFIAAVQSVSFRGMTSEAKTRIRLRSLSTAIELELLTTAEDEMAGVMAQRIFNLSVASSYIRSFLIMGDAFPEAFMRYSVKRVPHLVVNGRVHAQGVLEEEEILERIATVVKTES